MPERKLENILERIGDLIEAKRVPVRVVASVYGKLVACKLAYGPVLRLYTRLGQRYYSAEGRKDWEGWINIQPFRAELDTLRGLLRRLNGFSMFGLETPAKIDLVLASDASAFGFGVVQIKCGGAIIHESHPDRCSSILMKRLFTKEEKESSSANREITAMLDAYVSGDLASRFAGRTILHITDAAAVKAVMKVGSPIPELQSAALAIHGSCRMNNVLLKVEWRPRSDQRMVEADEASRLFDLDDWGISYPDFKELEKWAGQTFTFDLFASPTNAKCEAFATRYQFSAERRDWVNAFSLDWSGLGFTFACPPPGLAGPAIKQFIKQKAKGVLVLPAWHSARFWPLLTADGTRGRRFARRVKRWRSFLFKGEDVQSNSFAGRPAFDFFALFIDGSIDRQTALCPLVMLVRPWERE